MDGTVKWYNIKKGYGFIKGDDGQDYFVHYSAMPKGMKLNENDRVTFDSADTERGKQARNVKVVGAAKKEEGQESDGEVSEETEEFQEESEDEY
jgi:cold shock CspA family protein